MKIGVNLINYGPGATPDQLVRWARLAEVLGYHLLMVSDHVATTPEVQAGYPAPFYAPFVTLPRLKEVAREEGKPWKTSGCVDPTRDAAPAVRRLTGKPAKK